ncbi:MAG: aspartate--tRNA(Asn) ligase [Thermoplasmata archaeon]
MQRSYIKDITNELNNKEVKIAGFLQEIRSLSKLSFFIVRDITGTVQCTLKKANIDENSYKIWSSIERESVIEVVGIVKVGTEAKSGIEIEVKNINVVSRAQVPLPLPVVDKVNATLDTRLNNRFLDVRKERIAKIFKFRSVVIQYIREFLISEGFIEIETPKIVSQGAEGGATLFPIDYFGNKAYLAQSPQLYKQMAMASGLERVFEISHAFRAEPSDTIRHLTEFTSLDIEMSYIDSSEDVRNILEKMILYVVNAISAKNMDMVNSLGIEVPKMITPFPRVQYDECKNMLLQKGINVSDIGSEEEKILGQIISEKYGADFYFITDFPVEVKKTTFYAKRLDNNPTLTGYFDLEFRGMEITSGGQREHRYDVLVSQIKEAGLSPDSFEGYLKAFKYGIPTHGGFGFGVDRLIQQLLKETNIREVVLYPRDRFRLVP